MSTFFVIADVPLREIESPRVTVQYICAGQSELSDSDSAASSETDTGQGYENYLLNKNNDPALSSLLDKVPALSGITEGVVRAGQFSPCTLHCVVLLMSTDQGAEPVALPCDLF